MTEIIHRDPDRKSQRQRQGRTLSLQPARKLRHKCACHRRRRACHVGDDEDEALRIPLGGLHHLVGPCVGQIALAPAGSDPHADAAEILDQGEPQHDRDGPELAKLQRSHRLIGGHEAA